MANEYSSSKSYSEPVHSISLLSRDLVFLATGEQAGAKHSSAQCPEYMGLAATGVQTVLLLGMLSKNAALISAHFTISFFVTHLCEVWKDVYTFKTQPGMKLMLGGTSITAQIIRQSVY